MNKNVKLIGWIDRKPKNAKFVQLQDGYGHIQLVIEKSELKDLFEKITETDLLQISGRVVSRPKTHKFMV